MYVVCCTLISCVFGVFVDVPQPWSSEEQKVEKEREREREREVGEEQQSYIFSCTHLQLLEKALRTYPSSVADRWDKIAELVKTRTKEECITRFKVVIETSSFFF